MAYEAAQVMKLAVQIVETTGKIATDFVVCFYMQLAERRTSDLAPPIRPFWEYDLDERTGYEQEQAHGGADGHCAEGGGGGAHG